MTKEEIIQAAQKESAYQLDIGSQAPLSIQEGFIKGAEWMQERLIENPDGGALLYAVVKTAEKTKKEMIEKAAKFIHDTIYNWTGSDYRDAEKTWEQLRDMYIKKFKQAMED